MIDPGQMRTRLYYQTPTPVSDRGGSSADEWLDAFAFWGRVRPVKADEPVQNGPQVRATVEWEVVCRFDPRINTLGRLRLDGTDRTLAISSVVDWEFRAAELTLRCHERIESGA